MPSVVRLALLVVVALLAAPVPGAAVINVHVVCHSHDDPGWLNTVDQYFYRQIRYTLTGIVRELALRPDRQFSFTEQSYFTRWWDQQDDATRASVRRLVASGQLNFINGGWSTNDEAGNQYVDMIDQMTRGHRFIAQQFGSSALPSVSWMIDPFGHSATQAALLVGWAGLDAMFFARIDSQDQANRRAHNSTEFVWKASPSLGRAADIFAGQLYYHYSPPPGLCFDIECKENQIQDDPRLEEYNVDAVLQRALDDAFTQAAAIKANAQGDVDIIWTMGEDFDWNSATYWYTNLDKLIHYLNANGSVHAFYSNPGRYVQAKADAGITWPQYSDDFFPYNDADDTHAYWTGYFTSRPALKRFVRTASASLAVARQLDWWSGGDGSGVETLWEALSILTHHDGVAGTSTQAVTNDFALRLARGVSTADRVVESALSQLVTASGGSAPVFVTCLLANESICNASALSSPAAVLLLLYNPLARNRTELVTVPVSTAGVEVRDGTSAIVSSQVTPLNPNTPFLRAGGLPYQLQFIAHVSGLGLNSYFLQRTKSGRAVQPEHQTELMTLSRSRHPRDASRRPAAAANVISNGVWELEFDAVTNLLSSARNLSSGVRTPLTQQFYYYPSFQRNGEQDSGAYIFRPAQADMRPLPVNATGCSLTRLVNNPALVSEVQQTVAPWLTQTVRLVAGDANICFEWSVGPVPVDDGQGKEVVTVYQTDISNAGVFRTDSNGREFQRRVLNYRPGWNLTTAEPVGRRSAAASSHCAGRCSSCTDRCWLLALCCAVSASNYYPVNSMIVIADADGSRGMAVVTDRTQGGSSLVDGQLELMIHRRCLVDDGRGVGEALSEPGDDGRGLIVTGSHALSLLSDAAVTPTRTTQSRVYSPLHQSYAALTSTIAEYAASHHVTRSFLATALPPNVELTHLYSQLERPGHALLRLSHTFALDESAHWSGAVDVDIAALFANTTVLGIEEMNLFGTTSLQAMRHRLQWRVEGDDNESSGVRRSALTGTTVTMRAMEVRTFSVQFGR